MTGHCEGSAQWESFECCACVRENNRSSCTIGIEFVLEHVASGLLTRQKSAERCVPNGLERHHWVGFDDPFAENAGYPSVDVVYDKSGAPQVLNRVSEQHLD
jgi:hypothetical protein